MQIFNVCTKRVYNKNGEEKTVWYKVGELKVSDTGQQYIRLFYQPNTDFYVFEKDPSITHFSLIDLEK